MAYAEKKAKRTNAAIFPLTALFLSATLITADISEANPLAVPYIRQSGDTNDNFNGASACGATSAVMIAAFYDRLPADPILCTRCDPNHYSDYGKYVSEIYDVSGFIFDINTLDASDCNAYGAYGYIHHPDSNANAFYARNYFWKHGLLSNVIFDPCELEVKNEIDKGHPVWASTNLGGRRHIVVVKGHITTQYDVADPWPEGHGECFDGSDMRYGWDDMETGSKWIVITEPMKVGDRVKVLCNSLGVRSAPGVRFPTIATNRDEGDIGTIVADSNYEPFCNSDDASHQDYHTWIKVKWDKDEVVGWSAIGDDAGSRLGGTSTDDLWIKKVVSGFQGLGDLPGGRFYSMPFDVSADGSTVVGASISSASDWPPQAFRWTEQEGMVALGDLPGGRVGSYASGVSADGSVVVGEGLSASAAGPYVEAFRWTEQTGMVGLGDLPGGDFGSIAYDVSADGSTVVGYGTALVTLNPSDPYPIDVNRCQAFRWQDGTMTGLGFLPILHGERSVASAVSADGSVVVGVSGSCDPGCNSETGFRWENGTMTNLGEFAPVDISPDASFILGDGAIGWYRQPIIWDPNRGARGLKDMLVNNYSMDLHGFTQLHLAVGQETGGGMSDDGLTIVGCGYNANHDTEAWIASLDMGMITAVRGNVTLSCWPARLHDRVARLDVVKTGDDGYVRIRHPSGSEIGIAPNSLVQVDGSITNNVLHLPCGQLWAKVVNLHPGELEIRTPVAVIGPRGTELVVKATSTESQTIVLEGSADVSTLDGSETVVLGENQEVVAATEVGLGAPLPVDPNHIDRWWEWEVEGDFYADFDLEYFYRAPLGTTHFDASNQNVTPSWRLELNNAGQQTDPNWQIDRLEFLAPYELLNLDPEPDIVEGHNYVWTDISITPGGEFEVDAHQDTLSESVRFPYTITRDFTGNAITGQGDLTTTVTIVPEEGITAFDVEIFIYAAQSEQAWHNGNFFGALSSVSHSMMGGEPDYFEHEDSPTAQVYEWGFSDSYVHGEPLTFTVTVHVDLNAAIDWALIEPGVEVSGCMDADFGSENWVENTLQLANEGGTIAINGGPVRHSDSRIPWIGIYMPQYVASSKFDPIVDFSADGTVNSEDLAMFASAWKSTPGDPNFNPAYDISEPKDCVIDELDLAVFAENWLARP